MRQRGKHDLYLDWLRGIAALLVFVTHVRGGFFVKWSDLEPNSHTAINYVLFFATRLGREAVIVFFVLSGYLVGGQALTNLSIKRYSFRRYMIARCARLYAVVLPALVLTGMLDAAHGAWNDANNGIRSFLTNLLFFQGIFGGSYGSNAPLWSLAYEWWFYVLFGLTLVAIRSGPVSSRLVSLALITVVALMLFKYCDSILWTFPLWLGGAAVYVLPSTGTRSVLYSSAALAVFLLAVGFSSTQWSLQGDYVVGAATALLIYFLRDLPTPDRAWFEAIGRTLAAFSFSLYALHYPLNYAIQSFIVPQRLDVANLQNWALWTVLASAMLVACYVFYWAFERRTPVLRAWLTRIATPGAA